MRMKLLTLTLLLGVALPLAAQEGGGAAPPAPKLLSPNPGLMFWTVIIFLLLMAILSWKVFPAILGAVEARERSLEEAIQAAKRDREQAGQLLEQHRQRLEAARDEAQKVIADARAAAEQVRQEIVDAAHREQANTLERARQEIQSERDRAIAHLRREAVDLAIKGASKVIEKNLDDSTNRGLVERYLASITPMDERV